MSEQSTPDHPASAVGRDPSTAAIRLEDWRSGAGQGKLRVQWGQGMYWRLERLARERDQVFPDMQPTWLERDTWFERPLIVIGEETSGGSSLLHWLNHTDAEIRSKGKASNKTAPEKMVDQIDLSYFEGRELSELVAYLRAEARPVFDDANDASLIDFLVARKDRRLVVLMRLDRVAPEIGTRLLGQLRAGFESARRDKSLAGLALVLMGHDERAFDSEPYSALADVCEVTRLPRFDRDELALLLARRWCCPDPAHATVQGQTDCPAACQAAALTALRITGGQPLLSQMLLHALPAAHAFDARRLYRHLRDSPPDVLATWRQRLARMILGDTAIADCVRDLVRGHEYPIDPPSPSLPSGQAPFYLRTLSLSGWLSPGLDATGERRVWRFSDLHQYWAGPVLNNPGRYLDVSRQRP